ncbi:MAG: isoprenylcysteine carboxylmethyltransferase family protein [Ignavibacteriaceae bacterium]
MDPINIIAGLNLVATFGANLTGAKKGLKSTIGASKEKPKTYLQKFPLLLATLALIGLILGVFQIGTFDYTANNMIPRLIGLLIYITFSWIQIWSYRTLGESYSQEIVIFKNHKLVTKGPFKLIRHPQYLSQILLDLGAGIATLSYIIIPLAIIQIPFVIMRANLEEKLLSKHIKEFAEYKSKSGFMIPFIG